MKELVLYVDWGNPVLAWLALLLTSFSLVIPLSLNLDRKVCFPSCLKCYQCTCDCRPPICVNIQEANKRHSDSDNGADRRSFRRLHPPYDRL